MNAQSHYVCVASYYYHSSLLDSLAKIIESSGSIDHRTHAMHQIMYMELSLFGPRVIRCGNPNLGTPLAKL